ncbi:MerR family transcriptional regulator [Bacillus sp. 31A1R]|uniref:MerR family transcriptional regulator n=1 Tax=Robertmurraya mangrovi TaxID=3098077 RepID=A0ABU5IWR5_9BACI|nr:MerR family transcriptional regulator [Bacillus sp. 31A1R]MDZ5471593.1 MerR family transcriptional regulator [Bacillus sp. 31A1R]
MHYKIKEIADLIGVSVRTLHHYDDIGLLKPETITSAGYRLYTSHNLERLQQILFFKEIGFNLQEIKEVLDSPNFDRRTALLEHKQILQKKRSRLDEMIQTVEKTIQSIEGGIKMENKEMFKGFSMRDIEEHKEKYSEEAKQKYGKELVESVEEKTNNYSENDWQSIQSKTDDIYSRIYKRMNFGPSDEEVQKSVGEWRQLITDHFYDCTIDIFRGLGDLYVNDPRFTKNIDKHGEGLAAFLREAIHVYCNSHSKE